ncbi:MAG TPA: L-seryl-tRNA(Sec) selenium transferase [Gemmatimonadales bacterium]|jgi:L-seryl-tRNA(Ser) seleniumtransferase|nr:L-seryl-tRNA(Sec) selenium transferase [Gemmatimonadales bacterium]
MDDRRRLPSVDRVLRQPEVQALMATAPRAAVVAAVRESIEAARTRRAGPPEHWGEEVRERLSHHTGASLLPVLNATGVVLHTNLGRAPLADVALRAIQNVAQGYSNLEFDLPSGARGSRSDHCRALLQAVTGAEDGLVVNNAAGALVLALNTVADGRDVLISRGELIEIGGSFRIPDIIEKGGARLREVGTTNRTHLEDYRAEVSRAAALLTVHRSNFEQRGFVTSPEPAELAKLAASAEIPYLYDVGSGLLLDLSAWGLKGEPTVQDAVLAGAGLVIFSGDKLLGGPQAGCLVGRADLVGRCRSNPLARALRADKLSLAALAATLNLYLDPEQARISIPVLSMLTLSAEELQRRAQRLAALCSPSCRPRTISGLSAVGGGAFAGASLPTTLVALDSEDLGADGLALRLRHSDPPVVTRVAEGRVLLDPRTLPEDSFPLIARAIETALLG